MNLAQLTAEPVADVNVVPATVAWCGLCLWQSFFGTDPWHIFLWFHLPCTLILCLASLSAQECFPPAFCLALRDRDSHLQGSCWGVPLSGPSVCGTLSPCSWGPGRVPQLCSASLNGRIDSRCGGRERREFMGPHSRRGSGVELETPNL